MNYALKPLFFAMTFPNSKNTELSIQDSAVRSVWAVWLIFVILTALIGDTIILIASIKYKAIKLHGVIVVFIQHIAVGDVLVSLTWLLPCAMSLIANEWVFGDFLCYVRPYFSSWGYQAVSLFVCGMITCKLLVLKYPIRSVTWTEGHAHRLCVVMWILALYWPPCMLTVEKDDVSFDYIPYTCDYEFSSHKNEWKFLQPIATVLLNVVLNLVIVVTTVMILVVARRVAKEARRGLRWQGVMTVVLTAAAYSLSFVPMAVYRMALPLVEKDPSNKYAYMVPFYRVATSLLSVNVMSNFFIYSLTVTSFRNFLRLKGQQIMSCLFNIAPSQRKFASFKEGSDLILSPNLSIIRSIDLKM